MPWPWITAFFGALAVLLGKVDAVERAVDEVLEEQLFAAVADPHGIEVFLLIGPERVEIDSASREEGIPSVKAGPVVGIELGVAHLTLDAAASHGHADLQRRSGQVVHVMAVATMRHEIQKPEGVAAVDVYDVEILALALDQEGVVLDVIDAEVRIAEGEPFESGTGVDGNGGPLSGSGIDVQHAAAAHGVMRHVVDTAQLDPAGHGERTTQDIVAAGYEHDTTAVLTGPVQGLLQGLRVVLFVLAVGIPGRFGDHVQHLASGTCHTGLIGVELREGLQGHRRVDAFESVRSHLVFDLGRVLGKGVADQRGPLGVGSQGDL